MHSRRVHLTSESKRSSGSNSHVTTSVTELVFYNTPLLLFILKFLCVNMSVNPVLSLMGTNRQIRRILLHSQVALEYTVIHHTPYRISRLVLHFLHGADTPPSIAVAWRLVLKKGCGICYNVKKRPHRVTWKGVSVCFTCQKTLDRDALIPCDVEYKRAVIQCYQQHIAFKEKLDVREKQKKASVIQQWQDKVQKEFPPHLLPRAKRHTFYQSVMTYIADRYKSCVRFFKPWLRVLKFVVSRPTLPTSLQDHWLYCTWMCWGCEEHEPLYIELAHYWTTMCHGDVTMALRQDPEFDAVRAYLPRYIRTQQMDLLFEQLRGAIGKQKQNPVQFFPGVHILMLYKTYRRLMLDALRSYRDRVPDPSNLIIILYKKTTVLYPCENQLLWKPWCPRRIYLEHKSGCYHLLVPPGYGWRLFHGPELPKTPELFLGQFQVQLSLPESIGGGEKLNLTLSQISEDQLHFHTPKRPDLRLSLSIHWWERECNPQQHLKTKGKEASEGILYMKKQGKHFARVVAFPCVTLNKLVFCEHRVFSFEVQFVEIS